jgi:hypothetical protein
MGNIGHEGQKLTDGRTEQISVTVTILTWGARGSVVVKALCYKPEGRCITSR